METLISQIYIDYILSDTNVSLVEIWNSQLFIWRYKGKPTFLSNLGLKFQQPLYYRVNEYKQLSRKYHPDLSNSKSSRVLSGVIQAGINDLKETLEIQNGRYDARNYTQWYAEFDRILSCKVATTRSDLTGELSTRLYDYSRGLRDCFSEYTEHEEFTECLQKASEAGILGKIMQEYFKEREPEVRARLAQDEIDGYNRKCGYAYEEKKGIRTLAFPIESYQTSEGHITQYGASSGSTQDWLRRKYGNVFSMYVGGPCDCSPYEERVHWFGSLKGLPQPKPKRAYNESYTQQLRKEQQRLHKIHLAAIKAQKS